VTLPFLGKTCSLSFGQAPDGESKEALSEPERPLFEASAKSQIQDGCENATNRKHQPLCQAKPPMLEPLEPNFTDPVSLLVRITKLPSHREG